jgi:hypothetical protein
VEFSNVAGHCGKPCRMSLLFGLKAGGACGMLCVQGGWLPASTYGAAVEFSSVAGHCGNPCRMSLLIFFFVGVNRLQERNPATNVTPQKVRQESGAT